MTALALSLALQAAQGTPAGPPWASAPWRLVTTPWVHVGARPALYVDNEGERGRAELGAGATLQVTLRAVP